MATEYLEEVESNLTAEEGESNLTIAEEDDPDSDPGFESDGSFESTTTATSSVYHRVEEMGRTYHTFGSTQYWGPNDEPAQDLLDLSHHFYGLVKGRLLPAPVKKNENIHRILDLGTGTGIWAINAADMYPSAEVIGMDISPIQPNFLPPNLRIIVEDFNSRISFGKPYDIIHARELLGSVRNWPKLIKKNFKSLKPGGWLVLVEPSIHLKPDDDWEKDHPPRKWIKSFIDAGTLTGMSFDVSSRLESWCKAAGFIHVEVKIEKVPIGGKTEPGMWNKARLIQGVPDFSQRILSKVLGWENAEVQVFLANVRLALSACNSNVSQDFYFVHCQKPVPKALK